jgi:ATP-dependent exoDNAse (exonuclease V) beta subunit
MEATMSSPGPGIVPGDAAVRRAVLDTTQSWMLQAPAGSGKTELLMQRYLACLARAEQPESVLAITFTRKAAAEMRNRILASLQTAATLSAEEIERKPAAHERESLGLARKVLVASEALRWNLLENPSRLQIRTLDSFCEAVAQRAPFKGLLGGAADVSEDARPLYELAAQRVIDQLADEGARGDAVAVLLRHLDNSVAVARNLLAAMLAQRDQWLHFLGRSDAFDEVQQRALRVKLEDALTLSIEEDLGRVREVVNTVLNASRATELFGLMRYATSQRDGLPTELVAFIAAGAELIPIAPKPARPLNDIAAWPAAKAAQLAQWRAICDFLLTADGSLRKSVNVNNGFPSSTPEEKARRKRCMEVFGETRELPAAEELCDLLGRVRRLPDPHYTESQWEFMRAVLQLLPLAAAHLKLVFSEQGTIDFAEYAQRALESIGEEGDPTELGLQLGYRIRHILVDEFQDTNGVQVELLARLLHTWEADEECSTFYVGDPMQSIYAFRQADVAIYQQARRGGVGGHLHLFGQLSQNFRSQRKLVEWFNSVFPLILREESDLTNAVCYGKPAEPSCPALDGAPVLIRGFATGDRAGEAKHLAQCVLRELCLPTTAGEKPSSVAVLVRSRSHLSELVEALRAEGIRYRAVKTDRLADRPLVRDLEALRAAINDRADRTAWLSILRAPWCGLGLSDLLELCRGDERSTLRALLREREERLSSQARAALQRVLPVLDEALAWRGRETPRELVESAWLRLGGPACIASDKREQGTRDAEAYFALLDAQTSAGAVRDPGSFAKKLHDLYSPANTDRDIRVEIMPIHQAKGLEWDVVFLPALERRSRQDDKSLLYWRQRHRDDEEFLLLGPMEAAGKKSDRKTATIESYMRDLANGCSREELKRLFYVAATRAKKRLYLSATVPEKSLVSNSFLRLLWDLPGMPEAFAPEPVESDGSAEQSAPELLLRRLPVAYAPPVLPEALLWSNPQRNVGEEEHHFEWVGDLLPRVGVVAHSFLQRIAQDGPDQWSAERVRSARRAISAALLGAGVVRGDLEQGIARVSLALTNTLQDARGRWVLSPHPEHGCEFAVSAEIEGRLEHVRVDRTFIEDGTRWLIDYKITERQGGDPQRFVEMQVEKYRPDMQRYARVLSAFDPRPVRCALYLPLLGAFCPVELT